MTRWETLSKAPRVPGESTPHEWWHSSFSTQRGQHWHREHLGREEFASLISQATVQPAWSDVYIDGSSANGWETRVEIQQVLGQRNVGNGSVSEMTAQSQGGASTRMRCHLQLLTPRSGGGQMLGRQTNQPPTKAVLRVKPT